MTLLPLNETLLNQVQAIAYQAGELLLDFYQNKIDVEIKQDNTPVTAADLAVSRYLIQALKALTPNVPIISEESCHFPLDERTQWSQYWLVDPLDGTQQFINKTDQFSVLIALLQHNRPVLGVIYQPVTDLMVYAMDNFGAFQKQQQLIQRLPIQNKQSQIRIVVGNDVKQQQVMQYFNPNYDYELQRCGSSGIKGVMVAQGKSDCYIRLGKTGEWDTAAVECILAQTGGSIVDLAGNPLQYNQKPHFVNPDFIMLSGQYTHWNNIIHFQR